jgi:polypeptide N-acetylgalactosaminyltransferase
LRCIHSIYNRTPKSLLHEIILVNDNSSELFLYEPLEEYVAEKFNGKVKVFHNTERLGLIVTRLDGAKKASGEVIVFLDSHIEVNTNWLPPLLDPIKKNRRTATTPCIGGINAKNFDYQGSSENINGGFNWNLRFQYFFYTENEKPFDGEPFVVAAMTGGAYAINREYFFELGGYDKGLYLYNGENYEMSFKLHMCGGSLMRVPCSKIGKIHFCSFE